MQIPRTMTVYALLGAAWLIFAGWQWSEHARFQRSAHMAAEDRAREIGSTLSVVIRSQSRYRLIWQERLEDALKELIRSNDLQAVMLLNASFGVVAQAGTPVNLNLKPEALPRQKVVWGRDLLTFFDLVDLGWSAQNDNETSAPAPIVVRRENLPDPRRREGRPDRLDRAPDREDRFSERGRDRDHDRERERGGERGPNPFAERTTMTLPWMREAGTTTMTHAWGRETSTTLEARRMPPWRGDETSASQGLGGPRPFGGFDPPPPGGRRPPSMGFFRPFGLDEERLQELRTKQGAHGFVLQMPIERYLTEERSDLRIRITTIGIGLLAVVGLGFGWRSSERMSRLQLRLLKASEMNAHLQELNVAAAGLAHETRNPLNIVRGLAQLVAQNGEAPGGVRQKAAQITMEVDRVTGRLNEFINYSRTPAPRTGPTNLAAVIADVERALESDCEEKALTFVKRGPALMVEADEALLRQVIFNLLLNAFQSVGQGGRVELTTVPDGRGEAALEVRDDGPGVAPELRQEIFKPYFTTRQEGTGLGLAVVRQIVLAHRWDVECIAGEPRGAGFRVSGLQVISQG